MARLIAILLLLGLGGCASLPVACTGGQQPRLVAELLFGRNIGDRVGVSEVAFGHFVDTEISPRFPDGLTVVDTAGQWRDASRGRLVREPGKLVLIVLPEAVPHQERIDAIVAAYKSRFRQHSVGVLVRSACASF